MTTTSLEDMKEMYEKGDVRMMFYPETRVHSRLMGALKMDSDTAAEVVAFWSWLEWAGLADATTRAMSVSASVLERLSDEAVTYVHSLRTGEPDPYLIHFDTATQHNLGWSGFLDTATAVDTVRFFLDKVAPMLFTNHPSSR